MLLLPSNNNMASLTIFFSAIDGKVIHLVPRPPPSVTDQASSTTGTSGTSCTEGEGREGEDEVGRRRGVRVQASQDLVIVGNIPVSSHNDITQVTQVNSHTAFQLYSTHHGVLVLDPYVPIPLHMPNQFYLIPLNYTDVWFRNLLCPRSL